MSSPLLLYPAMDLLEGRCVRLQQGRFDAVSDYGGDPSATAEAFEAAGATHLHLVDLSGARNPAHRQTERLLQIIQRTALRTQVGGGLRDAASAAQLLDAGAERVVIGSAALSHPALVHELMQRFGPERVTLALDLRLDATGQATVATHGWQAASGQTPEQVLAPFASQGLPRLLVTDIGRDGMLSGPNIALYSALRETLAPRFGAVEIQVSGGIASLDHLRDCRAAGLRSAIVGRALYEGRFTLREALAAC